MTFYLKPPRGDISLEKLEDLALKRWKFLCILKDHYCHSSADQFHENLSNFGHLSEATMENNPKDRVSHFILRLVMSQINDYSLKSKWIELETLLFSYRLNEMFDDDLAQSLKDVIRHLSVFESSNDNFEIFAQSLSKILEEGMLHENERNKNAEFKVPFDLVPSLVSKRTVELEFGQAKITTKNVIPFLHCLFSQLIRSSLKQHQSDLSYGTGDDDYRMVDLIRRIKDQVSLPKIPTKYNNGDTILKAQDIETISQDFPLCFRRVHQNLKTNHRIGHHARIAYTLFLKEIGLSLEESLQFWSHYYSKDSKSHTTRGDYKQPQCSHSWQKNHKKFEYSINHLYGNVGSSKNYSAHSCSTIANRSVSIHEELTCPFNDFDIEDLGTLLSTELTSDKVKKVTATQIKGGPVQACTCYLQEKKGLIQDISSSIDISKPSEYMNYC